MQTRRNPAARAALTGFLDRDWSATHDESYLRGQVVKPREHAVTRDVLLLLAIVAGTVLVTLALCHG